MSSPAGTDRMSVEGKGIQRYDDAPKALVLPVQGPLAGLKASLRDGIIALNPLPLRRTSRLRPGMTG